MKKVFLTLSVLLMSNIVCFADQPVQVNNGRYVMYQNATFKADQYVLDTKTGKIWQMAKTKDGYTIFQQVLYDCYNDDKSYSGTYVNPR